jgi:hypothetical protein
VNAPVLPEVLLRPSAAGQVELQLATEGVLRYVWESRFGPMLIEVKEGQVYVNGGLVERAEVLASPR